MKFSRLILGLCAGLWLPAAANEAPSVALEELSVVEGKDWTGSLTYLNYQEPYRDFTITAALEVTPVEGGLKLAYKYPDEPQANSTIIAKISDDGRSFMGEPVVQNTVLEVGGREIKTAFACDDMGRPAACEMTYSLSPTTVRIKKMVTYVGETESFRRNEYVFTR